MRRALLVAMLLLPAAASAQGSQKAIRIIVPFAPGASADGIARAIGNELGTRRGKPVVIENNVGAGGSLGLTVVAKSPPDGDTLGIGATGALLINPNLPNATAPDLLRELGVEMDREAVTRAVQSYTRRSELWLNRREYRPASHHGIAQAADERQPGPYPLPRQRAGRGRSYRRPNPGRGGRHHLRLSAYRGRPAAGLGHRRGEAVAGGTGDTDHR